MLLQWSGTLRTAIRGMSRAYILQHTSNNLITYRQKICSTSFPIMYQYTNLTHIITYQVRTELRKSRECYRGSVRLIRQLCESDLVISVIVFEILLNTGLKGEALVSKSSRMSAYILTAGLSRSQTIVFWVLWYMI